MYPFEQIPIPIGFSIALHDLKGVLESVLVSVRTSSSAGSPDISNRKQYFLCIATPSASEISRQ